MDRFISTCNQWLDWDKGNQDSKKHKDMRHGYGTTQTQRHCNPWEKGNKDMAS